MPKTAVVLAGGGSRGAYQIGVWQALRELDIPYHIVTGTSVGALNGAFMVQGDFDAARQIWENISSKDVLQDLFDGQEDDTLSDRQVWAAFVREALEKGGADVAPLERMIRTSIDEQRFRASPVDFALVTVEYPSLKPCEIAKRDIPAGMLTQYLLASAACFPAFKSQEIEGKRYIDGGYHDNMPVNLALALGADEVIAVDLESVGLMRKVKRPVSRMTVIRPGWPLGSFLRFERNTAQRNIRLGYLDGMKAFGKLDGYLFTFRRDSCFEATKRLHASTAELLDQARKRDPKLTAALSALLTRKMMKDFRQKTQQRLPFTVGRQLILAAEYAGCCLRLNPTQIYDFQAFGRQLLAALEAVAQAPAPGLSQLSRSIEELRRWEPALLLLYFTRRIREFLKTGKGGNLLLLAGTFWKEFLAAGYLCCLENLRV